MADEEKKINLDRAIYQAHESSQRKHAQRRGKVAPEPQEWRFPGGATKGVSENVGPVSPELEEIARRNSEALRDGE